MREDNEATVLLETLQALSDCLFLSDLHADKYRPALLSVIRDINADAYSVQAWNYAASYIAKASCTFSTAVEAQGWLADHLASK